MGTLPRLYREAQGRQRLKTEVWGSSEEKGVPVIDAVASRSADGERVFVKLVNTSLADAIDAGIELRGVAAAPRADLVVLTAPDLEARNDFATPDAVVPRRETIPAGNRFHVLLPKQSVSVLTLSVTR